MVSHQNVLRLVINPNYIRLDENTRVLQTGEIAFDASTLEIWGPLLNGGTLYLYARDLLMDTERFEKVINENCINTLWLTSALFNQLVEINPKMFKNLSYLLVGGEKLSEEHIELLDRTENNIKLINGYGPTENTTFTTTYEIPKEFTSIPIGKPISNTKVYVLNGEELCGIGVPGELVIAGDGLSRGYLNRPELTDSKFKRNLFGDGCMYRSGDLARWSLDGNIEYLGRIDEQVKIRGFRIELEGIVSKLREIPVVKEAAVIVSERQGKDKCICAYVSLKDNTDVKIIRDELREKLPEYMIPSYICILDKLPLTRNGKLDKRALPEPIYTDNSQYIKPRNEEETIITRTFESVLGINNVSVTDSFYDLGGDSIKAIRVVAKIRDEGYDVSAKVILGKSTPENIAKELVKKKNVSSNRDNITGISSLTPVQKLFFASNLKKINHFNQSLLFECNERIDKEALIQVLVKLTVHHDMLRSIYRDQKLFIRDVNEGQFYDLLEKY